MRAVVALGRAQWLTMASYRTQMLVSMGGMIISIIPLYFIADAVQPIMADSIRAQGGQAFDFLLIGTIMMALVPVAVSSLPQTVASTIRTGTLEAMMATPAPLTAILAGFLSVELVMVAAQTGILMAAGSLMGADIVWSHILSAGVIMGLIVLSYLPFGLMAAALVLVFRTAGPLPKLVILVSTLLGGVYYPTHVIPSWLELLSRLVPLTYGLRSLRQVILEGAGLGQVSGDLLILLAGTVLLLGMGFGAFGLALSHARRHGNLAQY